MAGEPPRKRRRPALSCCECRRRKVKCDREQPCNHCQQSKVSCVFSSDAASTEQQDVGERATADGASTISNPSTATIGIASVVTSPRNPNLSFGNSGQDRHIVPVSDITASAPKQALQFSADKFSQRPSQYSESDRTIISSSKQRLLAREIVPVHSATPELQGVLSKNRLYGPTHYTSGFELFDRIRVFMTKDNLDDHYNFGGSTAELHALLQGCKDLTKRLKAYRPGPWQPPQDPRTCIPSRDIADILKAFYFRNFESTYRILHIPTFNHEYKQYWGDPSAVDDGWVFTLLLVLAIGSCFVRDLAWLIDLRPMAMKWIYLAQSWHSAPFQKSRMTHSGLQLHCLLLLARQTNYVGPELVGLSAGTLMRTGIHMGLHRDPNNYPKMSPFNTELRRRLWATIIEMALQTSLDCCMPPMFSSDDYDTLPPRNIDDYDIAENSEVMPPTKPNTVYTDTSMQIALLSSLPTRLAIARMLNHFRSNPSYDEVLRLSSEVSEAIRNATRWIKDYQATSTSHKPTLFHSNVFQLSFRRFFLALHLPFSIKSRKARQFYFSRKVSLEQAFIISTLKKDEDFWRLIAVGGGMFREFLVSGAFNLCLELITQVEEDSVNMSLEMNRAQRQPYREAIKEAIDLAEERMRLGETNVKGYLFLSMALGQIDAMEEGVVPEEGIFAAAKQSAARGYDILKSRLASNDPVIKVGEIGSQAHQIQAGELGTGAVPNGTVVDPLSTDNVDLNFDQWASWFFPASDEIPWASIGDFSADMQV